MLPEDVRSRQWMPDATENSKGEWQATEHLGVAYTEILPVTVAAIQEQQQQIETLKAENQSLKQQYSNLEQRLKTLEQLLTGARR